MFKGILGILVAHVYFQLTWCFWGRNAWRSLRASAWEAVPSPVQPNLFMSLRLRPRQTHSSNLTVLCLFLSLRKIINITGKLILCSIDDRHFKYHSWLKFTLQECHDLMLVTKSWSKPKRIERNQTEFCRNQVLACTLALMLSIPVNVSVVGDNKSP